MNLPLFYKFEYSQAQRTAQSYKGPVINNGDVGLQNWRGGSSFTPKKRGGGAGKVLAMPAAGTNMFWGSFNTDAQSFSPVGVGGGGGGAKSFHTLKGGAKSCILS